MADIRRIVTLAADGTPTTVRSLEDGTNYFTVRDSFTIKAPPRRTVMAAGTRRYEGSRAVAETHDNAEVSWKALVAGSSADDVLARVENMLGDLEAARTDLWIQWQPDGSSKTTYYEVRGPATWNMTYQWASYAGAWCMYVDIAIPVAPLARQGTPQTISISSTTMPAVVSLGSAITGDAPAKADVSLRTSGGSAAPIWALIAWWKRVTATPLSGSVAPFGVIEAESGTLTTWSSSGSGSTRGGNYIVTNPSGSAGSATATYALDPSVVQPDDWASTVDVEVWARVQIGGLVAPKITLTRRPSAGASFGSYGYPPIYGSAGKQLVNPSSGTVFRFMHVGTLTFPVDPITPVKWDLTLTMSWAAGSSGTAAMDYLCLVPARARCLSPTGKANDSTYPQFIRSTSDTTRTVRSDLSGATASATANSAPDAGLGGSPILLPPGDVDMLIKLSSLVPDDPTSDTTTEQLSHTGVTGTVSAVPRFYVVAR